MIRGGGPSGVTMSARFDAAHATSSIFNGTDDASVLALIDSQERLKLLSAAAADAAISVLEPVWAVLGESTGHICGI